MKFFQKKNRTAEPVLAKKTRNEPVRVRDKTLGLRLTEDELNIINENANALGISRAEYIMRCVNGATMIRMDDAHAILKELHKQGNNLNQIARVANTTGHIEREDIDDLLRSHKRTLGEFREFLHKWNITLVIKTKKEK